MAQDAQDGLRITDQFDFEVFWGEYGKRITIAAGVILALVLLLLYRQHQSSMQAEQAAESLELATDVTSLERVISSFPGSPSAAEALVRLADFYYRNGRYADAASAYQRIERDFPENPLAKSARLGVASTLEAQGNWDGAKVEYEKILNEDPTSYVVTGAKMGLARCLEMQGQKKEAGQYYEEVLASAQNSPWAQQAYLRLLVLNRNALPEKPDQSSKQAAPPSQNSVPQLVLPKSP